MESKERGAAALGQPPFCILHFFFKETLHSFNGTSLVLRRRL